MKKILVFSAVLMMGFCMYLYIKNNPLPPSFQPIGSFVCMEVIGNV